MRAQPRDPASARAHRRVLLVHAMQLLTLLLGGIVRSMYRMVSGFVTLNQGTVAGRRGGTAESG